MLFPLLFVQFKQSFLFRKSSKRQNFDQSSRTAQGFKAKIEINKKAKKCKKRRFSFNPGSSYQDEPSKDDF